MPGAREKKSILKRAGTSRPSGTWKNKDYDVLADGEVSWLRT
jgi:hypothetical protein